MLAEDTDALDVLAAAPEAEVIVDAGAVLDALVAVEVVAIEVVEGEPTLLVEETVAEVDEAPADAV